ncbi:MAG: hypothetical protein ACP5UH_02970 [Candidatus Micrarchaeia archaeon]
MESLQAIVFASTVITAVLSSVLAAFLSYNYTKKKAVSYIFWAAGMWLFAFGVILEALFALNIANAFLFKSYLFVVVLLVELLSLGSAFLSRSRKFKIAYATYIAAISAVNIAVLATADIGNILSNYVVFGLLPSSVVIASSLGTFPAAAVLIIFAALAYRQRRSAKMLSIIAGTIVVSIAGTLYIAAYPEFLYYAEFVGILLLWLGFFDFRMPK